MAKIHGTYEYDDDGLTPGKKKEGGLHQNLFDAAGDLKGSARFIPDDHQPDEDYSSGHIDPYFAAQWAAEAEVEEHRREREQQENAELILKVLMILGNVAYEKGLPRVQQLWQDRVGPALQAKREARTRRKIERKAHRELKRATVQGEPTAEVACVEREAVEGTVTAPSSDIIDAPQVDRRSMSRSEAQARYLMALAAKAFSDEQLRMVTTADINEDEQLLELESALVALPPAQVAKLIEQLKLTPSVLTDESFDLAMFLAEVAEPRRMVEIRERRGAE